MSETTDGLLERLKETYASLPIMAGVTDLHLNLLWKNTRLAQKYTTDFLTSRIFLPVFSTKNDKINDFLSSEKQSLLFKAEEEFTLILFKTGEESPYFAVQLLDSLENLSQTVAPSLLIDTDHQDPEEVLGILSSQVRLPLDMIFSCLFAINKFPQVEEIPSLQEYIHTLSRMSYQILRSDLNFTTFLRTQIPREDVQEPLVDLLGFFEVLCRTGRIFADELKIPISFYLPEGSLPYHCNPDNIAIVFFNLLSNAMQYTRPGNKITVTITWLENSLRVSITDRGAGISADYLDQVFQPYFSRRPEGGTSIHMGLGLTLSKQIVQQLGGRILLHSVQGEGTTVTFTLPIKEQEVGTVGEPLYDAGAGYFSDRFSIPYLLFSDLCDVPEM